MRDEVYDRACPPFLEKVHWFRCNSAKSSFRLLLRHAAGLKKGYEFLGCNSGVKLEDSKPDVFIRQKRELHSILSSSGPPLPTLFLLLTASALTYISYNPRQASIMTELQKAILVNVLFVTLVL